MVKKRISQDEWVSSDELFSTSYLTFDKIRDWCKNNKWIDASKAIDLYLFYCKGVSIQETKQVYCSVRFAAKWLWRTTDTITKYRKVLESIWCIEHICKRDDLWKVLWWYVKVKFAIPCPTKASSGLNPDVGQEGQNTGWYKNKILDDIKIKNWELENFENSYINNTDYEGLTNMECAPVINKKKNNISIENKEKMFIEYWKLYPNKQWKAKSLEWYKKNVTEELHKKIIKWVISYKRNSEEKKLRKEFVPEYKHSTTFLNGKCREDFIWTTEEEAFREAYEKSNPQIYSWWCKDEIGSSRSIDENYYKPYNDLKTAITQKNNEREWYDDFIYIYQTKWKK